MIKIILITLLLQIILLANNSDINEYSKPPISVDNNGSITNFTKVDLLYGYEIMLLDMKNKVEESESDIVLTNGGRYEFDSVALEYKKVNLSLFDFAVSYELKENKLEKEEQNSLENQLKVKIMEIIGGYGTSKYTNTWLNHTSNYQIIKRDAKFSGQYALNGYLKEFEMDKTRYSFKFMDNTAFGQTLSILKYILYGEKPEKGYTRGAYKNKYGVIVFGYWQLDYENSTLPLVIYSTATDGENLNFIDPRFETHKYTLTGGTDIIGTSGLILGYRWGLGYSDIELSPYGEQRVKNSGTTNLDTSSSFNYQGALKLGYNKQFTFKYTEFELGILYEIDYLNESSSDYVAEENDDGKAEIIYNRTEILQSFKVNARWSF